MNKLTFVAQLSLDFIFGGVKKLPEIGEEVMSSDFDIQLGGGTLVYPIILSKLGVDCRVILKKDQSIQSDLAYKMLSSYNIKEVEVLEVTDFNTIMSTAAISIESDRSFVSYNDERALEFKNDFLLNRFKCSKVVFAVEQNIDIIPQLKENGSIIVFDIGWSDNINIEKYEAVLKYVDYFTPNDKEAMKLTNTKCVEDSLIILKEYVKHPIISCGSQGCKTIVDDKIIHVGMPKDIKAIDTTGAGDNFMAGLIYAINQNMTIEECMKFANCTGGLSTTEYGCYGANYSLADVYELFNNY